MKDEAEEIRAGLEAGEPVQPTGKCFDDALDIVLHWMERSPGVNWNSFVFLCHGICLLENGEEYSHAWLERHDEKRVAVWQAGIVRGIQFVFSVDKEEFYAEFKVKKMTRYTLHEAWAKNKKHGTYGPWDTRYLRLCKDKRRSENEILPRPRISTRLAGKSCR